MKILETVEVAVFVVMEIVLRVVLIIMEIALIVAVLAIIISIFVDLVTKLYLYFKYWFIIMLVADTPAIYSSIFLLKRGDYFMWLHVIVFAIVATAIIYVCLKWNEL